MYRLYIVYNHTCSLLQWSCDLAPHRMGYAQSLQYWEESTYWSALRWATTAAAAHTLCIYCYPKCRVCVCVCFLQPLKSGHLTNQSATGHIIFIISPFCGFELIYCVSGLLHYLHTYCSPYCSLSSSYLTLLRETSTLGRSSKVAGRGAWHWSDTWQIWMGRTWPAALGETSRSFLATSNSSQSDLAMLQPVWL